ncbi:peptidase associated domain and porin domain-containing protein [Myroides sp. LJL110]
MRYTVLLFVIFCFTAKAQNLIKGRISDELTNTLPGVSVSILDPQTKAILAYSNSNDKGEFSIAYKGDQTKVILRAFLMNYGVLEQELTLPTKDLLLELIPEETILEEIFIKASLITQHNDTLVFDLNSFASKNDRVLEDVIKKMPGLEVLSTGEIQYQGKSINKFYVEGKDLMQGGYGAITKALPNLHVSKLEVLENHQPIKMLQGKIASSDAAINIRLKNKVSFSGSGKLGLGASPLLYNASVSPMFFSKGLQYLVSYDANNTGEEPFNKFRSFGSFSEFDVYSYKKTAGNTLSISGIGSPDIKRSRYLFNKTNLVSANFLNSFGKDLELNTNVFYFNNYIKQGAIQTTQIYLLDSTSPQKNAITYTRDQDDHLFDQELQGKLTLTRNGKENYLKNILTLNVKQNKNRGLLLQNNDPISQSVFSPSFSLQNSFTSLIPFGSKKMGNFKSIIDYTTDKQNYGVIPNGNLEFPNSDLDSYQELKQFFNDKTFYTQNAISVSWTLKKWTLTQEYNLLYIHKDFNTQLFGYNSQGVNLGENYQNDLIYHQFSNALNSRLYFKGVSWDFSFSLPISYNSLVLKDNSLDSNNTKNRFNILPRASLTYRLNGMITFVGSINYFNTFTPVSQLYPNYIFSGLNFSAYQSTIEDSSGFTPNLRMEYKNPFNGLFANASLNSTYTHNKIILSRDIDANGQEIIKAIQKNNNTNSYRLSVGVGKFFADFSTNLRLNYAINTQKSDVLVNQELLDVKTNNQSYGLNLSNNHLNWLNFNYNFTYNQSTRSTNAESSTGFYQSAHEFSLDVIPLKSHSLIYKLEYKENQFDSQHFSSRFMDLVYRFKWDKKKVDIDLAWQNILNQKQYNQVVISQIQSSQTIYEIRPMQVVVSVRFTF